VKRGSLMVTTCRDIELARKYTAHAVSYKYEGFELHLFVKSVNLTQEIDNDLDRILQRNLGKR
jgi:hypothetical protein